MRVRPTLILSYCWYPVDLTARLLATYNGARTVTFPFR